MKKIATVLVLLLITSALFAAGDISVRLGGAFSLVAAKNPQCAINKPTDGFENILTDYDMTMEKAAGFGFDTGLVFKLSSDYNLYFDFSMTFPSSVTVGSYETTRSSLAEDYENDYNDFKDDIRDFKSITGKTFLTNLEFHVGFTKNIALNDSPFILNIGGGLGYRRISSGEKMTLRDATKYYCYDLFETLAHISLDLNLDASYKVNDNFAVGIVLMPGITFYSSSKLYATIYENQLNPVESKDYYGDGDNSGMKPKYENSGFAAGFTLAARIGVSYTF